MNRILILLIALVAATRAELPPLPQPATSFGAALADGWLYVYGGNTGKAHEFHRDCVRGDFFRLKVPGGTAWEPLPGGTALLSASLVAHGGKVIRVGGLNARNASALRESRSFKQALRAAYSVFLSARISFFDRKHSASILLPSGSFTKAA